MEKEKVEEWIYDSGPVKVSDIPPAVERNHDSVGSWDFATDNYAEIESTLREYKGLEWAPNDESNLTLYHPTEGPMCEIFKSDDYTQHFVMYNDDGQLLVDVDLTDGSVIYGEAYSPNEASQAFWDTLGKVNVKTVEEAEAEYEAIQKDLNMYKQLYDQGDEILREVRHNIGTPEGENVVEYSAQFSAPPGIADDMPVAYYDLEQFGIITEDKVDEPRYSEEVIARVEKEFVDKTFDDSMKGLIDG